ncbi:MAG: DUF3857 domain-containing protein [Alphaproteobacteria bacterium]|nr:DUF3857 domain-containing protein [Alphaproteobacteria bacterium]
MLQRFLGLSFLLLLSFATTAADEPVKDAAYSIVRSYETHMLNAEGADTASYERAIKVLKDTAIESMKQTSISYSTSVEKGEIIAAYTQKPDGRKIEVPKDNYQLEVNSGKDKGASPVYSDYTTLGIIFPDVAVNDTLVLQYKITQSEPMFPKHYSDFSNYNRSLIYEDARVTYDYPTSLPIRSEVTGLTEKSNVEKDGRRVITWTYQNKNPVKSKRDGASVFDFGSEPSYIITTFPSYAAIAEAYGARAKAKAIVTPRIQQLADTIVGKKTAPREQAAALYDWVAQTITYAGNCIGVGAVVPRDLDFVLDNKMGDCKDHATLLQALLMAKKIESTQALINAGAVFRLPKLPAVMVVNHVINYIPSLDLYLDSTSEVMPFGVLPHGIAGKPVLLVDGYMDGTKTPMPPKHSDSQTVTSHIEIKTDGSATGTVEALLRGEAALRAYTAFKKITPSQEEEFLKNMPKRYHYDGKLTLDRSDKGNTPEHMKLVFKFDVKKFLELGSAGGFYIYPLFVEPMMQQIVARASGSEDETVYDFACRDGLLEETYTYILPKTVKILAVPENLQVKNDVISYNATYAQDNNTIKVHRLYDDSTVGPVCTPKIAALYKEAAEKVRPNLKAQIVYQ